MKGVERLPICVVNLDIAAAAEGWRCRREERWGDGCRPLVAVGRAEDIGDWEDESREGGGDILGELNEVGGPDLEE
jgi:hypothetical protein